MLQLNLMIQQQFGRIGLEQKNAQYNLDIQSGDLEVRQTTAEIHLEQHGPELYIDYSPFLESLGIGGLDYILQVQKNEAQAQYLDNLGQTVSFGKALGEIERKITIGEAARQADIPPERDLQMMPTQKVHIAFETFPLLWEAQAGGIQVESSLGHVGISNFTFPQIEVYWEQEPYIKIEAVGQLIDYEK